jgi:hypothetical protein
MVAIYTIDKIWTFLVGAIPMCGASCVQVWWELQTMHGTYTKTNCLLSFSLINTAVWPLQKKKYIYDLRLIISLTVSEQLRDDGSVSGSDADVLEPSKYRLAQSRITYFRMHFCRAWRVGGRAHTPIRKWCAISKLVQWQWIDGDVTC